MLATGVTDGADVLTTGATVGDKAGIVVGLKLEVIGATVGVDVGFLLGAAVQALVGTVDLIGTDVGDTTGADELEQGTFA